MKPDAPQPHGTAVKRVAPARPGVTLLADPPFGRPLWKLADTQLLMLIVVVGLNLRPLLTSVSPLLTDIRSATGMSYREASLLTVLPVAMMGGVALMSSRFARLVGTGHGIAVGLAGIAMACAYRFLANDTAALILSSAVAGFGVAVVQALMPAVIKHNYAGRTSMTIGLYSAALMGGGGFGAALSPWVAQAFGDWHWGLAVWSMPAGFALLWWLYAQVPVPGAARDCRAKPAFSKNARAWLLAIYFGWINGGYTSMVAWLPLYYVEQGWTFQQSGSLLGLMTVMQVVAGLLLPFMARKTADRRPWLALGLAAQLAGFIGVLASPGQFAFLWIATLGFGLGGTFSLCIILALDHLKQPNEAGELTAFMQGIGFMIAALAPLVTGFIRDITGSFSNAWLALTCSVIALLAITLRFDPKTYARSMRGLE